MPGTGAQSGKPIGLDIENVSVGIEQIQKNYIVPKEAKNRFLAHRDVIVFGELKELQLSVWGIIMIIDLYRSMVGVKTV